MFVLRFVLGFFFYGHIHIIERGNFSRCICRRRTSFEMLLFPPLPHKRGARSKKEGVPRISSLTRLFLTPCFAASFNSRHTHLVPPPRSCETSPETRVPDPSRSRSMSAALGHGQARNISKMLPEPISEQTYLLLSLWFTSSGSVSRWNVISSPRVRTLNYQSPTPLLGCRLKSRACPDLDLSIIVICAICTRIVRSSKHDVHQ